MTVVRTASLYFGIVFGIGFVLGTIRVFWVAPRVGSDVAELLETPLMLVATVLAARWICRRFIPAGASRDGIGIGLLALAFLLAAELGVGVVLRRMKPIDVLVKRDAASGAAYYAGLVVFGVAPWLLSRPGRVRAA